LLILILEFLTVWTSQCFFLEELSSVGRFMII